MMKPIKQRMNRARLWTFSRESERTRRHLLALALSRFRFAFILSSQGVIP